MNSNHSHIVPDADMDFTSPTTPSIHSIHSVTQASIFTGQPSPSSLTFSDMTCELFPDEMENLLRPGPVEDIRGVMTQVLCQMERVVQHAKLRAKGELEAANIMAKNIIAIVTTLNETTAGWEPDACLMQSVVHSDSTNDTTPGAATSSATSPPEDAGSSWAKVAAAAPTPTDKFVKVAPNEAVQAKRVDTSSASDEADPAQRVVWIRGWNEHRSLSEITRKIGHGPLFSMTYSPKDGAVCIIFQRAASAKALYEDEEKNIKIKGVSKFGDCELILGQPFPETDDMRRMSLPHNERRRLTFARQQLFTNGLTEQKFKDDIYNIVGEVNVELVWLFNTGNATAIFSAVPLARLVRQEFIKHSKQRNSSYYQVDVSYSQDPCEKPMQLTTQMTAGHELRRSGTYGGASGLSAALSTRSAMNGRRNGRGNDPEGWQTVGRRR